MNEDRLVDFFRNVLPESSGEVLHWAGDDGSLHRKVHGKPVTVVDLLIENVHFSRKWSKPEQIGYKAVTVNYSDLASCGVSPSWFMLGLGVPASVDLGFLKPLYNGIYKAMTDWGGGFAGGDFSRCEQVLLSVSAGGYLIDGHNYWGRNGATPGDYLYCSGTLGLAALGLQQLMNNPLARGVAVTKQLTPPAPLPVMNMLRDYNCSVTSCADISDGLSTELNHLAVESGVDFVVERSKIPAVDCLNGLDLALYGGEDYELVFTVSEPIDTITVEKSSNIRLSLLGRVYEKSSEEPAVYLSDGSRLKSGGYDHFNSGE